MTDLETRLREAGSDLRLDRPVTEVIARGKVVRRRRRATLVAVSACAAVAALAVVPVVASRMSDGTPDNAPVSAPPAIRLAPAALAAADGDCRAQVPAAFFGDSAEVFGADRFGDETIVLYRTPGRGTAYARCDLNGGGLGWGGDLRKPGHLKTPTEQRPLSPDEATVFDTDGDGNGALVDIGLVGPSVSRVVAQVDGETIEGSLNDGWFWFATAVHRAPGDISTPKIQLRAYDASGALVDEVTLNKIGSITDHTTGR